MAIEGFARDVTEWRYTENQLRASEARFRSLVETAPSVIIGLAEDGQFLEFNPEAERVFGCRGSWSGSCRDQGNLGRDTGTGF